MKISLNKQISSSRLPAHLPKYIHKDLVSDQIADIVVRKDKKTGYSLIYLPMDYHSQNPGYLPYILQEVAKQQKKLDGVNRILLLVLMESNQYVRSLAEVQDICLKGDINMMLCFEVGEVANMVVDIIELK